MRKATSWMGVSTEPIAVSYDGRAGEGVNHVQAVNNYHERLLPWTNGQLQGVATKYPDQHVACTRLAAI